MFYQFKYQTPDGFNDLLMRSDGESLVGLWFENSVDAKKNILHCAEKDLPIFRETSRWLDELIFLRSLTWRGFWAGVVGLMLPLCFVVGWSIVSGDYCFLWSRAESLLNTDMFVVKDYGWMLSYKEPEALNFALLSLLALIGIVHYLRNYYNDKIRTRMFLYIYVMQTVASWLLVIAMPDKYSLLAPVLMLAAGTMIAHFFALTSSLVSNLFFCVTIVMILMLFTLNLGIWTF